jgi:hypothetical protein
MKKSIKLILLIVIQLSFFTDCSSNNSLIKDIYNLNFSVSNSDFDGWVTKILIGKISIDSLCLQDKLDVACIEQLEEGKYRLLFKLSQTIHISTNRNDNEIAIKITNKAENLQYAHLRVVISDKEEKIKHIDSLNINQNKWEEYQLHIKSDQFSLVNIEIEGYGDTLATEQKFWIEGMSIFINGIDINSIKVEEKYENYSLNVNSVYELPVSEDIMGLFENKKIIAFGETVHCCTEINKTTLETIKDLIIYGNCKLVFFEISVTCGLLCNSYVESKCDTSYLEYIRDYFDETRFNTKEFCDFFVWLREHNAHSSKKTKIAGMDVLYSKYLPFHFLYSFYQNKYKSLFLPVLKDLFNEDFLSAYVKLNQNRELFEQIIGIENYNIFSEFLKEHKNLIKTVVDYLYFENKRELSMYHYFEKITEIYHLNDDEQIALYAHFGHTSKINGWMSNPLYKNVGYFLNRKYGAQYCNIGITVGVGNTFHYELSEKYQNDSIFTLPIPPSRSVEKICIRTLDNNFLFNSKLLPDDVLQMRGIGSLSGTKFFFWGNIRKRTDYIMFIPQNSENERKDINYNRTLVDGRRWIKAKEIFEKLEKNG